MWQEYQTSISYVLASKIAQIEQQIKFALKLSFESEKF